MNRLWFQLILLGINLSLTTIFAQKEVSSDVLPTTKAHARVCGDTRLTLFDLRRGVDAQSLASCEIILGSITYAPMHSLSNFSSTNNTPIIFPHLREVYGYILLGYSSISSFSTMFPRLSIIHGRYLYHGYSVIIMDNFLLEDLGFTSLISIRRGNVIIARNAQLCHAKSVRWSEILETKKSKVVIKQNRDNCEFCPLCPSACWSTKLCQLRCPASCKGNCMSETVCCPEKCVGGCDYQNSTNSSTLICSACRNMRIHSTGICIERCPDGMLKAGGSLCVTREECVRFFDGIGFILQAANECVSACPHGFLVGLGGQCIHCDSSIENNYCSGTCRDKHIRSVDDFVSLKYCTRVHTLNIYNIDTVQSRENIFTEAFSAFENLKQIDHEFTIHNVKVLSTLAVFSRLEQVGITSAATITIEENEFLTELWPLNHRPPRFQGSLNIVRNARLCPKHVFHLINLTTNATAELMVTNHSKNEYANGYLASCESSFLTITISRIRSLTARVNAAVPREIFLRTGGRADHLRRPFISIYYKVTKTRNETHFDVVQSNNWLRFVEKANYSPTPHSGSFIMNAELSSLLGDEWYAVYASLTSNVNTIGLYSPIVYFRTEPRQPEPVLNLRGESISSSEIELNWEPPSKPNGPITAYLIYYAPIIDRLPTDNAELLCLLKDQSRSKVTVPLDELNLNSSTRCSNSKQKFNSIDDEFDENKDQKNSFDQVVTDLSILEYQLINSVSQRKAPMTILPEVKDTIINDLDQYFEDKSSSFNESNQDKSEQQTIAEHKPRINKFNRTTSTTRIVIDGLEEAQTYMFEVYACHNITAESLGEACSLNGIIIAVRTKASNPSKDLVQNVQAKPIIDSSESLQSTSNSIIYQISWFPPSNPNGLIFFYWISIGQDSITGPKEERCAGHDVFSINFTLLPGSAYRLRITTYTIARLDNDYGTLGKLQDEKLNSENSTLFYEYKFTSRSLPNGQYQSQNRIILIALIVGSIFLLLIIILGAPFYYYRYGRGDTKASISKNPNYELYTPDQWEIEKDSVTLDRLIGQGHFGQVFRGSLRLPDGTLKPCAVKLRTTHPTDLLQEASIMKQFQCYHVIQLYGICSRIRPPYVVMELMENGDLKNYLQRHRQSEINPTGPSLTESAMIQLALDVADGMYYLSDQKFVHRDLAARNCLVNGNHTCKVGDFGLTRDIYETDYYRRGGPNFLPIRWMAPESLRDGRFDTVSDVWSFGVLLWEIATLAEQPYQGYGNEEVVHYVRYGNITLERPTNCPEILHKLMRACWTYSPSDRISFRSIVDELVPFENEDFHANAYYHTQPKTVNQTVSNESHHSDEEDLLLEGTGDENEVHHHHHHRHD